jgi:hypothetical protein
MKIVFAVLLAIIAFGTLWTAYESHIANIGVMAWQHQFDEIRQPDGPMDNHAAPEPTPDREPPRHNL